MKIISLTVRNVRGLPNLHLPLDAKNVAIWGPNGSGKSGVVDAIDFLFTGRISRLMGEGTSGITLSQHGPHIDHEPKSAIVKATLQLNGSANHVEISRCMAQPKALLCPEEVRPVVENISKLMLRGGVILTRRDILRYVTGEGAKRSDEIQMLLHLNQAEGIRKSLLKARNDLKGQWQSAKSAVERAEADVNVFLDAANYSDDSLFEVVNECRRALGGGPLSNPLMTGFNDDLSPPAMFMESSASKSRDIYLGTIRKIRQEVKPEFISEYKKDETSLRSCLLRLKRDPTLQAEYELLDLSKCAARFIDHSTTACPVCGAHWTEGHLKAHIENKIAAAQMAKEMRERIEKAASGLSGPAQNLRASVVFLEESLKSAELGTNDEELQVLTSWQERLGLLLETFESPVESYLDCGLSVNDITSMFVPPELSGLLDRIESTALEVLPQRSKEQTAWDRLTSLETIVQTLEKRRLQEQSAEIDLIRSEILLTAFEKARESVLEGLFSRISARFMEFYGVLHEDESKDFVAQLRPQGAALDFVVDFLGRGIHPPNALHSEGHQDSMGICLFLALNEELARERISLIVLDDVVMSIDAGHRKRLCSLLREWFPDRQFVFTTHDKTWARQLMNEGVVRKSQVTEFTNWTVEDGPRAHGLRDLWEDIQADLEQEDIANAAFRLRRGSEEFFESVCDALGAKLTYNSEMRWDLGDWLDAAKAEYKKMLKTAKQAASSWGRGKDESKFARLDSNRSQIFSQVSVEQWTVNPNVHYTPWADMSKQDFMSVIETFKSLHRIFQCPDCGGLIEKFPKKENPEVAKCPCGAVNWNLRPKSGGR